MYWVWWSLGLVLGLLAVDRLACWAEVHGWLYWRKRKPSASGGTGALDGLMTILQPSRQVAVQELEHRDMLRLDAFDDRPGSAGSWIDLGTNTAVIDDRRVPPAPD